MKLGTRQAHRSFSEGVSPEPGIRRISFYNLHSTFCIKIIFAVLLLLNFSGCLFMRPYTPSARLTPEGNVSYSFSVGALNYTESVTTSTYYSYENVTETTIYESPVYSLYLDAGASVRIPGTNLELNLAANFPQFALGLKYAFTAPEDDAPLVALSAAVSMNSTEGPNFGFCAGPIVNFNIIKDNHFDIVTAVYYQYYRYTRFGFDYGYDYDYYGSSRYTAIPSDNSIYMYFGCELAMNDGSVMAPGISYTYYLWSDYQPGMIMAIVAYKFNAADKKDIVPDSIRAPDSAESYVSAAKKQITLGGIKTAVEILAGGLAAYPGDYEMSLMQGFCMAKLGKKKLAYRYYRDALRLDPDNEDLKQSVKTLWKEIKGK